MAIETGIARQIRWKRQTTKGTLASGASGGQIQRRTSGRFTLQKETVTTEAEMSSQQQLMSNRHGTRLVEGAIEGILSPGTYDNLLSSVLRRDFTAVTSIATLSLAIAGTGPTYTITRTAGDFLTGGIKVGMVVRLTVGTMNAANKDKNLLVTAVTATVLTVIPVGGQALVAEPTLTGITLAVPGLISYVPASGHTNVYYTVEDWQPSVPYSVRSQDVKFTAASLSLPGSGNATISLTGSGLDQTSAVTVYFAAPTSETTTDALVAASGVLLVNGTPQNVVTELTINIDGRAQPADGVVGGVVRPDIFRGKVIVTGSFTAYFDSATLPDLFLAETNIGLSTVLTAGTGAAAEFVAISIPNLKLDSSEADDAETGQKRSYNFTASYNAVAVNQASEATTIWMQDSKALAPA